MSAYHLSTYQAMRIGVCTDTHFWAGGPNHHPNPNRTQLQSASAQIQQTLLAELERANIDLVLHLGDMTCGGGAFAMPEALFYDTLIRIREAFVALPMPVHALPGNHDCVPDGGDWTYFEGLWGLHPDQGHTIDLPHARLVLLNAQGHTDAQIEQAKPNDPVYGWVSEAELRRFDAALATANQRPVLVFSHQLLRPWIDRPEHWRDFYLAKNADAVLDVMAQHGNVRAVFQGHAHLFDVHTETVGGASCAFVVAPAIIEYPLSWLALTLTADALHVQLHTLPLPQLSALSRGSGQQDWRRGRDEWQAFEIALR